MLPRNKLFLLLRFHIHTVKIFNSLSATSDDAPIISVSQLVLTIATRVPEQLHDGRQLIFHETNSPDARGALGAPLLRAAAGRRARACAALPC